MSYASSQLTSHLSNLAKHTTFLAKIFLQQQRRAKNTLLLPHGNDSAMHTVLNAPELLSLRIVEQKVQNSS